MSATTGKPVVLLVEDVEGNRELVYQLLVDEFDVEFAEDGLEGVAKATQLRPDLVLMDLSLPGIDGWEATRRIKADATTSGIPIVALTAHAMASHRERAIAAGCSDYLVKPLDDELLLATVRRWIAATAH